LGFGSNNPFINQLPIEVPRLGGVTFYFLGKISHYNAGG
jgi:hypothetical protein